MFNTGYTTRSGDVVKQGRAFTLEVLHASLAMYEAEYEELDAAVPLNMICSCMVLWLTCLARMREYEAV